MTNKHPKFDRLTEKNIFLKKLSGKPIDIMSTVMNDMLGNDICLLLRAGILEDPVGQYYRFICRYPIRVWHRYHDGSVSTQLLDSGDIWEYGKRFE